MPEEGKITIKDIILYGVIVVLLVVIGGLGYMVLNFEKVEQVEINEVPEGLYGVMFPEPEPIQKPENVVEAEKVLSMERDVKRNSDGSVTILASLKGVSSLSDEIVLNDFVEDIRFKKKVGIVSWVLSAKAGKLFPSKNKLNIASYGPGPVDDKSTRINIVLLDVNFTKNTESTDLYEFTFQPEGGLTDELIFSGAEFRHDRYILELPEKIVSL